MSRRKLRRMRLVLIPLLLLAACSSAPPAFCESDTRFDYDPVQGRTLAVFPDDFHTAPDDATPTGLRPRLNADAPWLEPLSPLARDLYLKVDQLDGFGTSAGVVLRFSGPAADFPSGDQASLASDAVLFVELGDGAPRRVPFEVKSSDGGATVILWPMQPLKPKTRHAVVVTRKQKDAEGGCISPSTSLRALLTGNDVPPALASLSPRHQEVLSKLGLAADEVSAATVFTTGSIEEASLKVAADVATRSFQWSTPPACEVEEAYRACTGAFVAGSYTKDDVYVDGTVQSTYELPVSVWLPPEGEGPFPVVVFGHGLAGTRETGKWLAEIVAPLGLAVVAIDALGHGHHPTSDPDASAPARVLKFFGINLSPTTLEPFVMRDNFRASTWDKLQLVELLKQHPAVDASALDTDRMAYLGMSLGGIMASELLSLTDAFDAAVLIVAGARMGSIVSDSPAFSLFLEAFKTPYTTDGDVDSVVPLLQALIEPGDPVNYAPHVLRDRFPAAGARAPHMLFGAVIDDDTVVNSANHALARALGTPQLAPVVKPVGVVEVIESGPVSANLEGDRTAAFFQFDRYTKGSSAVAATHDNVWDGPETKLQVSRFLETWRDGGAPEIVEPYGELNTPPLP